MYSDRASPWQYEGWLHTGFMPSVLQRSTILSA
jgi:hypothetical protein